MQPPAQLFQSDNLEPQPTPRISDEQITSKMKTVENKMKTGNGKRNGKHFTPLVKTLGIGFANLIGAAGGSLFKDIGGAVVDVKENQYKVD